MRRRPRANRSIGVGHRLLVGMLGLGVALAVSRPAGAVCGNGAIDPGEECDPPGSVTCPPGAGAFAQCNVDCTCGFLDHFKCYRANGASEELAVTLADQFETVTATVRKPNRLCNPADKNGEGLNDPTGHLMCHKIKQPRFTPRDVVVVNQFGEKTIRVVKPETVCNPAEKDGIPLSSAAGAFLDHFKCYRARASAFDSFTVNLSDQFASINSTVLKPALLCNPVDKNGSGIKQPDRHLLCYKIRDATRFVGQDVTVEDQFGTFLLKARSGGCHKPLLVCLPSVKRCEFDVTSVEWLGVDPGDGLTNHYAGANPANRGGGDRIYAERNRPQGQASDQLHNKIKIRAKVTPPPPVGKTATVHFRVLDPDHYSTDAQFDPNGVAAPDDNIASGGAIGLGATLSAASATIVGNGTADTAEVEMTITARQPTNNFKAVAHCTQHFVNSVVFGADGTTLRRGTATGKAVPAANQTALLTVWRTAYLELDHMAAVNPDEGPLDQESKRDTGNVTAGAGTANITTDLTVFQAGQFQNGEIRLHDNANMLVGTRTVSTNTAGANSILTLSAASPATSSIIDRLIDDDLVPATGVARTETAFPDTTLFNGATYFDAACVFVDTTTLLTAQTNNVAFDLNMGSQINMADESAALRTTVAAGKTITSTDDFWVAYLQGAYQGATNDSTDPDDGVGAFPTLGIATSGTGPLAPGIATAANEGGVVVFYESMRDTATEAGVDLTTVIQQTTIHEVGHEFGMLHGDAGIMKSSGTPTAEIIEPASQLFRPVSLRRIIAINHPGFGGN